jgi:hypothetical protein
MAAPGDGTSSPRHVKVTGTVPSQPCPDPTTVRALPSVPSIDPLCVPRGTRDGHPGTGLLSHGVAVPHLAGFWASRAALNEFTGFAAELARRVMAASQVRIRP